MIRLLKIEFQKIWINKPSKALIISYLCLLLFVALLAFVKFDLGFTILDSKKIGVFNFPIIWHFNTYFASILKFFLAVVIVSMMANEYSYGTLKQNLIDGMRKKEFILSKFYMIIAFALSSVIVIFILTLILGFSFSTNTEFSMVIKEIDYLLAYFVKLTAFLSLCLFLSMFIKKSAFALGFLFIWNIIEVILYFILKQFNIDLANKIYNFFPLESMSQLIKSPLRRLDEIKFLEQQLTQQVDSTNYSVNYFQILVVLTWTTIFIYGSYFILKKRDL